MLVSQKLAIAAHLHVLLRRKTGRVTDTEWMAENLEYALEIVRFSRAKAKEDGHPDLAEWAGKLEKAVLDGKSAPPAKAPLVQSAMQMLRGGGAAPAPSTAEEAAAPVAAEEAAASTFGHSTFRESSGFTESTFDPERPKKPRDPSAPRYVGGIR
jgi:hypothetical protein